MATDSQQSGSGRGGEWHVITPEDEIKALERKLAEKKRTLGESSPPSPAAESPREKELFREVVREHIVESRTGASAPAAGVHISPSASAGGVPPAGPVPDASGAAAREQTVQTLVEYALTHTIEAAVSRAERETPYLIDELHDRLVDHYYEKLVQLRKLDTL
jgi:hypothetical protein